MGEIFGHFPKENTQYPISTSRDDEHHYSLGDWKSMPQWNISPKPLR